MASHAKFKRHSANCSRDYKQRDDYDQRQWDCNCNFSVQRTGRIHLRDGRIVTKKYKRTTGESTADRADAVIQAADHRGYWQDVTTTRGPKKHKTERGQLEEFILQAATVVARLLRKRWLAEGEGECAELMVRSMQSESVVQEPTVNVVPGNFATPNWIFEFLWVQTMRHVLGELLRVG